MVFPTIYRHGTLAIKAGDDGYSVSFASDPAIRSEMEAGYVISRARFTRMTYKWHVKLASISTENKNTIFAFEAGTKGGADSFTWYDAANTAQTVRFLPTGIVYTPVPNTNYAFWDLEFDLEGV
jgi:hypothetical protein